MEKLRIFMGFDKKLCKFKKFSAKSGGMWDGGCPHSFMPSKDNKYCAIIPIETPKAQTLTTS